MVPPQRPLTDHRRARTDGVWWAVTMSIRRMTLGAGYRYLMSSVARGDAARGASGLTAVLRGDGDPAGLVPRRRAWPAWTAAAASPKAPW